jgi:hypothetical protein
MLKMLDQNGADMQDTRITLNNVLAENESEESNH